jgi:hypothetical protein
MRTAAKIVVFVVATLILGGAAYNLWWELAVVRCRPDSCGWISDFAWDYSLPVFIGCLLLVGGLLWVAGHLVSRVRHAGTGFRQRLG